MCSRRLLYNRDTSRRCGSNPCNLLLYVEDTMEQLIANMISGYEQGALSRRYLIGSLVGTQIG